MKCSEIFPKEDEVALDGFFGNPRGKNGKVSISWFRDNIVKWTPPYPFFYSDGKQLLKHLLVHKKCLPYFQAAFLGVLHHFGHQEIEEKRLNICGGTFNYRLMRGSHKLSTHGYGIAIDMDPQHNPYHHTWKEEGGIDKAFINILETHGFYWRGHNGDIDPMHFQCAYRHV